MRASIAAGLLTGRRARGTSVLPPLFVAGILEAVGESGGAIQLTILSASIRVIGGFSWAGGLGDFFVS